MRMLWISVFVVSALLVAATAVPQATLKSEQTKDNLENPQATAQPIPAYKRLILKDGSYQPISKYSIDGKLVRYLSTERHGWEELPYSLVDWAATEKYEQETAGARQVRMAKEAEEDALERGEEEDRTPLVSPGLRLPPTGGVFLLDTFNGQPELVQLVQNGAEVNKNMPANILRAVINPVASSKRTIELPGLHARVQSHVSEPAIYVAVDSPHDPAVDQASKSPQDQFRIVLCEGKEDKRIVWVASIALYGKVDRQATAVETKTELLSKNWLKVKPATPLIPGEYALVELLGKEEINTFVWDFGVDPSAPENVDAQKGDSSNTKQAPVLQKRGRPVKP
ncbi:MAG: hypothetical protein U0V70_07810 [Terriglobia bacterium]